MKNLEEYLLFLGKIMVVSEVFKTGHKEAYKAGIMQFDEEEQAETIDHCLAKLYQAAYDQMNLVLERCNADEKKIIEDVLKLLN